MVQLSIWTGSNDLTGYGRDESLDMVQLGTGVTKLKGGVLHILAWVASK